MYSNKPSVEPQNFDEIAEDGTFLKIRQLPILGLEFEAESEQLPQIGVKPRGSQDSNAGPGVRGGGRSSRA